MDDIAPRHRAMRFSLQRLFLLVALTALGFWIYSVAYPLGGALVWILAWTTIAWIGWRSARSKLSIVAGLMVMFGVLSLPIVAINGHAVPTRVLEQVRSGDSTEQVRSMLGNPDETHAAEQGTVWLYSGPTWCHVTIQFGEDDRVQYVAHDH